MKLDEEQQEEVREAARLWRSYLGDYQANVILTPSRKAALATLVGLAEETLKRQPPSEPHTAEPQSKP